MRGARGEANRVGAMAFVALSLASCASTGALPPRADPVADRVDAYMRPWVDANEFSGVVAIARGDHVLLERAYGMADYEAGRPNTPSTTFVIASLSKSFTAAAVERLVSQGRLGLGDPLAEFFPDFPRAGEITVEMLLLHRSGVGGEENLPDFLQRHDEVIPLREQIARLARAPFEFAPGTSGDYSNSGYVLLAGVVEVVSGQPFEDFLRVEILDPLGLESAGVASPEQGRGPSSTPYFPGPPPSHRAPARSETHPSHFVGAGAMYATTRDLIAFLRASDGGPLDVSALRYPYGWGVREKHGRREIEQTGIDSGFISAMAFYPEEDLYVAYVANTRSGSFFKRGHVDLAAIVLGEPCSAPTFPAVDRSARDAAGFEGRYDFPGVCPVVIEPEGHGLWFSWESFGQRNYMLPTAEGAFWNRLDGVPVRFERGTDGTPIALLWGEGESLVRAPRLAGPPPP